VCVKSWHWRERVKTVSIWRKGDFLCAKLNFPEIVGQVMLSPFEWRCNAFRVVFADDGECARAENSECMWWIIVHMLRAVLHAAVAKGSCRLVLCVLVSFFAHWFLWMIDCVRFCKKQPRRSTYAIYCVKRGGGGSQYIYVFRHALVSSRLFLSLRLSKFCFDLSDIVR
jgi:hypothetical protein